MDKIRATGYGRRTLGLGAAVERLEPRGSPGQNRDETPKTEDRRPTTRYGNPNTRDLEEFSNGRNRCRDRNVPHPIYVHATARRGSESARTGGRGHAGAREGAGRGEAGRDPVLWRRSCRDVLGQLRAVLRHR